MQKLTKFGKPEFPQTSNKSSLFDVYASVRFAMEEKKSEFLELLKTHIKIETLIPIEFYWAFYKHNGRPRWYSLESFILYFVLQKILGIVHDSIFLVLLGICVELREFCRLASVPDAAQITRFKQDFAEHLGMMFERLVEITEPLCRKIDEKKSDYLIYDPTGIEAYVRENNPKFFNVKLREAKKIIKTNPKLNLYAVAYSLFPEFAEANPFVKHQYINGIFCYAHKVGILTNGIGIIRHIAFFDERFKRKHPEIVSQKTDNPDLDKEIGDSTSLEPVLSDFFNAHPNLSYGTFLGDSSFDSYDNYELLFNRFHFKRVCVPLNPRNSAKKSDVEFDDNGTPLCHLDKTPFIYNHACCINCKQMMNEEK